MLTSLTPLLRALASAEPAEYVRILEKLSSQSHGGTLAHGVGKGVFDAGLEWSPEIALQNYRAPEACLADDLLAASLATRSTGIYRFNLVHDCFVQANSGAQRRDLPQRMRGLFDHQITNLLTLLFHRAVMVSYSDVGTLMKVPNEIASCDFREGVLCIVREDSGSWRLVRVLGQSENRLVIDGAVQSLSKISQVISRETVLETGAVITAGLGFTTLPAEKFLERVRAVFSITNDLPEEGDFMSVSEDPSLERSFIEKLPKGTVIEDNARQEVVLLFE